MNGYEEFASYWFRKNVSEMSKSERNVVDPYYYIEQNKDIVADLAVWMIHGDCDLTIPLELIRDRYYHTIKWKG